MNKKITLIIALVLILSFSVVSLGAVVVEKIDAYRADDMKFQVDGEMWQPKELDGSPLSPIIYKDRSYVPVRALLEDKDVKVDYDEAKRTIFLDYPDWTAPKGQKYWDPDLGKNPDIGDIISGPIVWKIGGPYEELPDYTLILEEFNKLNSVMDQTSVTLNLDEETKVMIDGKEWDIKELVEQKKTFNVSGEMDGNIQFRGDKKENAIKYIEFDGKDITDGDSAQQSIKVDWEVSFSGPPFKIKITIIFSK